MAKFKNELPNDLLQIFNNLNVNTEKMLGEMTKAGAEKVYSNVEKNVPSSFKDSDIMRCLEITKTYKTPTDGGINTKVGFFNYFYTKPDKNGKVRKVPAPLVANVTEYGNSKGNVPKRPFFRKSFNKRQIENVMMKVQDKYIKGD